MTIFAPSKSREMKQLLFIFFFGITTVGFSQKNYTSKDLKVSRFIDGTILVPKAVENPPLAILIGDSGPTDRNGNQQMMNTNTIKFIAEGLSKKGIATFRYDKRILKQMMDRTINEESISFDEFIKDANDVIEYFERSKAFSKIYVIGHGQGSLVGMVAAQEKAAGFVSIAGAGQAIDDVIIDQLEQQAPGLKDNARNAFNEMRTNGVTTNYSSGLSSIFRKQIQPFMLTWMKYDPQEEITKLNMPVLIITGEKDMLVQVSEAKKMKAAYPDGELHIIPNMNHVLKEVGDNAIENSKSFNEPKRPISPKLVNLVVEFILK